MKNPIPRFDLAPGARRRQFVTGAAMSLALGSLIAAPGASAQLINRPLPTTVLAYQVYATPFLCGSVDSVSQAQVNEGLGAPAPLPPPANSVSERHQPGGYSTSLDVFNPSQRTLSNVAVFVSMPGLPGPQRLPVSDIPALQGRSVACPDIINAVRAFVRTGGLVSGFVYASRNRDDVLVTATYSYSTIAGFREFRGGLAETAGGGAGGLGLGSSVDIERIQPKRVQDGPIRFPN